MRLQKFLAEAGIASRRKAEEYIAAGRVEVNGITVREMGFIVNPDKDQVKYMNKPVRLSSNKVYIMLNKPAGCVSTCKDESGRPTVMQYVKDIKERLYPVGRLDFTTEGLLILTNDGEMANRLTHPKHNMQKKYLAVVDGEVTEEDTERLAKGVVLDDGYKTAPAVFKILSSSPARSEVLCVIGEGKNRQIRRMFAAIEKNVCYLKRVGIGDIGLGNLKKGKYRHLKQDEVQYLRKSLKL
ncbi:pseudouridine synthase [Christensenella timonensis]|uniref:pseudouridine synthase n=1 Tax=Christensenella timonensis TaxID=1816678 RepID=UPI00083048FC|nr:pseudouridine synthase [Christensenella timonensis]